MNQESGSGDLTFKLDPCHSSSIWIASLIEDSVHTVDLSATKSPDVVRWMVNSF